MAKSRSIPTALMQDPDYMELNSDAQVVLLMLVLTADDEGRGQAHTRMLSRHFNKPTETIEETLETLAELDLVTCYVVGRHRYYQLIRWWEWQTLSKPTPSRFPHPPASFQPEAHSTGLPRETQEIPGQYPPEGEEEGNRTEQNPEVKEKDTDLPPGVMRFPHLPTTRANAAAPSVFSSSALSGQASAQTLQPIPSEPSAAPTQQLATILRVPASEALTRLVAEYATIGSLALLGQADAAREWIDDRARNRHGHAMTVGFFRRWLQREQERTAHNATEEASLITPASSLITRGMEKSWRCESPSKPESPLLNWKYLDDGEQQAVGGER